MNNTRKTRTFTAAELLNKEFKEPTWAVPGIMPTGVTLFSAKPKMGKSWLALGLCVAVATGGVALGSRQVEQGDALYLALEDNERRLKNRLQMLLTDAAPENLHFETEWPGWDDDGVEELDAWLEEHPGTRLVVIDTLKKVRAGTSGRRNVYDVDYEALQPLVPVTAEHDVAILIVHHNNQQTNPDDPFDAISGSTGLTGSADNMLVMMRERGSADATLHIDGKDIEESGALALEWNHKLASWHIKGGAEEFRMSPARRAVVETIRNAGRPLAPNTESG